MNIKLIDVLQNGILSAEDCELLSDAIITEKILYKRMKEEVSLKFTILTRNTLPFHLYEKIYEEFEMLFTHIVDIYFISEQCKIDINELTKYGRKFDEVNDLDLFNTLKPVILDNQVNCLFSNEENCNKFSKYKSQIEDFMNKCAINYSFNFICREINTEFNELKLDVKPIKVEQTFSQPTADKQYKKLAIKNYPLYPIQQCVEEMRDVKIQGEIFQLEVRTTRSGKKIAILLLNDETDTISVKIFEGKYFTDEVISNLKVKDMYEFYGDVKVDNYSFNKDLNFEARAFVKLEKETVVLDDAPNKRVELHTHSNKSEMDGVVAVDEIITHAFKSGHRGVAITDHMVVQAFPKAQSCLANLLKSDKDRDFKVLYGCEFNVVDSAFNIVYNPQSMDLLNARYCVFDIETTGLSAEYDRIIEFGGVIYQNGAVIDKLQCFVNPQVSIPSHITNLTNITNYDVESAESFDVVYKKIIDFMKDSVLVAHNASFDYDFINAELTRINQPCLSNPTIDTLELARFLIPERKQYKLGAIARHYRVVYDDEVAHRADYDTEVLSGVFGMMLRDCASMNIKDLLDLTQVDNSNAFIKKFKHHCTVLAQNQDGLKNLFKLITISHTETLAYSGKVNVKDESEEVVVAEPRLLKETLAKYRKNILIGTACFNGEIFEIAANKTQNVLEDALGFYDYVEIQPLENYRPLIERKSIVSIERLKEILMRIISTAKKLNKIVVATGDVHYVLPKQKILRDIYISSQGIGGIRHPLYNRNQEQRQLSSNPNQHFRNTNEMLEEFSWLGVTTANELVIENPNKILDLCEVVKPVHDKLYTPKIEGADEKLSDICYDTARRIYGNVLPEIVEQRLIRELKSIIGNGFGVIYYISHLLVKKSNDAGYLVGSRGSVGSSFAATMSGITEVNPLAPHYVCPKCQYSEFFMDGSVSSGYDLPDKNCPHCNENMVGDGQNIPFETFLGFEGDKVPDIDLNFSGDYQEIAHAYTKEVFGEDYVYRAGTIGTVAKKTAFGYVLGYCEEQGIENMRSGQREYLASGCEGVKRTTGQHPGGIIAIPNYMEVHDFTPVNYPANNPNSEWKTTHFEFHDIHDNVLKFDILGHVDPTAMRLLQNVSGIDPKSIPMNDEKTMSLFHTSDALNADPKVYSSSTGACGLPEFGTPFVRQILELTKPTSFSGLVIISGLSHGTDVWLNNAKDLIESNVTTLSGVIGCRDDIMSYLIQKDMNPREAFFIMESVRKGKGLKDEWVTSMTNHNVPEWYIESCRRIKYMFPKAHAVAYVIMAVRIAWFKVHYPHFYYVAFFSLRCDAFEIETMIKGHNIIQSRIDDINKRLNNSETKKSVSSKEVQLLTTLESCLEMIARGYRFANIDLYQSLATQFSVSKDSEKVIIPPFTVLDGLGENVAKSIVEARKNGEFISKEDLMNRSSISSTLVKKLSALGVLDDLQEKNQLSLF